MVLVQDRLGLGQIEVILAPGAPGKFRHIFEEGADDLRLHRLARDARDSAQLAIDFLAGSLRKRQFGQGTSQLFELVGLVVFTQLLLDGLELLPQDHLPLTLAQFFLDLRLDVFLGLEHGDVMLNVHQHATQPLLHRQSLQQHLTLGRLDVDVPRDEIGKLARLRHAGQHLLHHLVRKTRLVAQLGGALPRFPVQRYERRVLGVQGRHLLGFAHDRL